MPAEPSEAGLPPRCESCGAGTARLGKLPRIGLPESVIEHTVKLYAAEVLQLQHIARSIRAVSQALVETGTTRPPH